jgi:hypothetical protein
MYNQALSRVMDAILHNDVEKLQHLLSQVGKKSGGTTPNRGIGEDGKSVYLEEKGRHDRWLPIPNILISSGFTALHFACSRNRMGLLPLLFSIPGINPNIKDLESGYTALHRCVNLPTCMLLYATFPNINVDNLVPVMRVTLCAPHTC